MALFRYTFFALVFWSCMAMSDPDSYAREKEKPQDPEADYVCQGDSIKLFWNVTFDPVEISGVTLYLQQAVVKPIVFLNIDTFKLSNKSENRIFRDWNNDIWLHGFVEGDEGVYFLLYVKRTGGSRREKERKLLISKPPSTSCKPKIQYEPQDKHTVIAYLTANLPISDCGKPQVIAFWLKSQQNTSLLSINITEKPGAYFACIKGPAMMCVRDTPHTEFCSEVYVTKYETPVMIESTTAEQGDKFTTNEMHSSSYELIIATLGISILHAVGHLIFCLYKRKLTSLTRKNDAEVHGSIDQEDEQEVNLSTLNEQGESPLNVVGIHAGVGMLLDPRKGLYEKYEDELPSNMREKLQ